MEINEIEKKSRKGKWFALVAALIVSLCCIFTCVILIQATRIFGNLLRDLGMELPLATRFLIATYSWLYPLLFVGAAVLVIAKEFVIRDMGRRWAATVIIFLVVISSAGLVQYVLNLPLLDLVQKLGKANELGTRR